MRMFDTDNCKSPVILFNISTEQLEMLEETFSYLTKDGWIIPDWLISMREDIENVVL